MRFADGFFDLDVEVYVLAGRFGGSFLGASIQPEAEDDDGEQREELFHRGAIKSQSEAIIASGGGIVNEGNVIRRGFFIMWKGISFDFFIAGVIFMQFSCHFWRGGLSIFLFLSVWYDVLPL